VNTTTDNFIGHFISVCEQHGSNVFCRTEQFVMKHFRKEKPLSYNNI